jgi:hypothetical protein
MPCVRRPGIEIVRGTITKRRLHADVTIGYAEPIPVGQLSHLYVAIQWHAPQGEQTIVLQLRPLSPQGGDVLFNGAGAQGSHTRTFSGNVEQLVAIYGQRAMAGDRPDVLLDIVIDNKPRGESVPLTVRQPTGSVLASQFDALRREMGLAVQASRPAAAAEGAIWDRYTAIFDDARAFAGALGAQQIAPATVPIIDGGSAERAFNLAEITTHLQSHRDPAGTANSKGQGHTNAFDAFEGHWRGHWRQQNDCGVYVNECQDHDWAATAALADGSDIYLQQVTLGPDSRAYTDPSPGDCLLLGPGRNSDIAAMNAINITTGVIVGGVGVRSQADADGVQSQRPHVGFFIEPGKLLWVADEGRSGQVVTYSVFYEISEGSRVEDQRYTIIGFDFQWDRTAQRLVSPITPKAGQYRKILTAAERQLEQQFRNHQLQPDHLQRLRYRRQLESLPASEVRLFLEHTPEGAARQYLTRLLPFVEQQAAWRAAPLGDRESITLVMGTDPFYTAATAHFTLHPAGALVTPLRTLVEVRDYLANHAPANGRPWGEVNIVVHANEEGGMAIPVLPLQPGQDPGVYQASPRNLRAAIDAGDFIALPDAVVDARTTLRIRGCALGRSQEMLTLLSQAFGGAEARRPVVRAPKHLQAYEFGPNTWHPGRPDPPSFSDEYFVEFWFVGFPEGQRPSDAQLIAQFTAAFPDAGVNWRDALRRSGPPSGDLPSTETRTRTYIYTYIFFPIPTSALALARIVQALDGFADAQNIRETARTVNPNGTTTIEFDYEQHGNAMHGMVEVGAPTSTAQRLAFFRQQQNLQDDLARVDLTMDDYTWQFRIDTAPAVEGPRHGLVHALVGTGRRTILRAQRELREPDPNNLARTRRLRPPVTDLTHFGEEVPARPAARPLGENVLP